MYINKPGFWVLAMLAVLLVNDSFAQSNVKRDSTAKRKYYFVLQLGGGISTYVSTINIRPIELPGSINRNSATGTIRLMWYPNHRLRVGLETGYANFYSYSIKNGNKSGKLSLHAVPMLVVWSMPIIKRVNIFAGFGSYLLTTDLNYEGSVKSKYFSLGSNIAINYTLPVTNRFGVAAELKWMNAFETKDRLLALQLNLVWKFLEY